MVEMRGLLYEIARRLQRFSDGPMTRRKLVIIALVCLFMVLYVIPNIMRIIFYKDAAIHKDLVSKCRSDFLSPYLDDIKSYDSYKTPEIGNDLKPEKFFTPYVGNGYFGLTLEDGIINIRNGRSLSLAVNFNPFYTVKDNNYYRDNITEYKKGLLHVHGCSPSGLQIKYTYYAHRTLPSLFVQEISINNPTSASKTIYMSVPVIISWATAVEHTTKLNNNEASLSFNVITGLVEIPESDKVYAVSIVSPKLDDFVIVNGNQDSEMNILTVIKYSNPIDQTRYALEKDRIENDAIKEMERAMLLTADAVDLVKMRDNHIKVWDQLWFTGFSISDSKAEGVINGDQINATMYAVLSQVRSYESELNIIQSRKLEIVKSLSYSEGCYEGHSTLEAGNLWKPLDSLTQINNVVSSWILTLEKQGCHNLIRAGASGVVQAMVLSYGSLRFSNQHLEYNNHPSNLHRDVLFRRVNYGNATHVNISVVVQEDNKAALFVALDRSDRTYYACDAGCLDSPIQLGQYRKYFPVKLTEPLTSILYLTSDKQHMEDLRHAIHVKEVAEAPPHHDHIIALHRHGSSMGELSPLFWVSICVLIVVFHLFLIRIVMTEYCDNNYTYRRLYNKPR